jgi:hypothetical protein
VAVTGAKYSKDYGGYVFTTSKLTLFFITDTPLESLEDTQNWINPFDDVNEDDWFYAAVKFVNVNGLMRGISDNLFSPDTALTRAMLVTILYRYEGEPEVIVVSSFSDVAVGAWYTEAINWASVNGIADGYGNGMFGTNDNITREQLATMLYRYAKLKGLSVSKSVFLSEYSDVNKISAWALDAMKWANAEKLINGRTLSTLAPLGTATRAETATILQRFIENNDNKITK